MTCAATTNLAPAAIELKIKTHLDEVLVGQRGPALIEFDDPADGNEKCLLKRLCIKRSLKEELRIPLLW